MAVTIPSIINAQYATNPELNVLDANVETPYTAAKILTANLKMLMSMSTSELSMLKLAHCPTFEISVGDIVGNRTEIADEWVAYSRQEDTEAEHCWQITSTVQKPIRACILKCNGASMQSVRWSIKPVADDESDVFIYIDKADIEAAGLVGQPISITLL